jgi:hypothetical protein
VLKRWWSHVLLPRDLTRCWIWLGGYYSTTGTVAYGRFANGRHNSWGAHQVSYAIHKGVIPPGMCVLHSCDNPRCVNPAHLRLGTRSENTLEMVQKGRHRFGAHQGEHNGGARLTEAQVIAIRARHATKAATYAELASEYGIGKTMVWRIVRRFAWRHVP